MKKLLPVLSFLGLALVLAPPIAYLAGSVDKASMSTIMLVGTLLWFATVSFWMGRQTR